MNKTIKKTLLLSLWTGLTLCGLANASEGLETMRERARQEAEGASAKLCTIEANINEQFEARLETERLQHQQEVEAFESLLAQYKKTIDTLQNKKNRIVKIQKNEIVQHGETQESCDMQADIEELNNQIVELTQQYGLQIEKLQKEVRLERSSAKYQTQEYRKLQNQLAQTTGQSIEAEYGYADYLMHPAVVGTATTITTAIVSYIIYQYVAAQSTPTNNESVANTITGLASMGLGSVLESIGETDAARILQENIGISYDAFN